MYSPIGILNNTWNITESFPFLWDLQTEVIDIVYYSTKLEHKPAWNIIYIFIFIYALFRICL